MSGAALEAAVREHRVQAKRSSVPEAHAIETGKQRLPGHSGPIRKSQ